MTTTSGHERPSVAEVIARERDRLAGDPNIVSLGVGIRYRNGEPTDEIAIQYDVRRKFATESELAEIGTQPIPPEIDGYPTDVMEIVAFEPGNGCGMTKGTPTGERGSRIEDPLLGGTSTAVLGTLDSFPHSYGTLGGICFDLVTDAPMALSNAHVWGTDTVGQTVIQPWLPIGELLGSAVKVLACGPLAYLFEWQWPSPATAGLAVAATTAWMAAAASDAEDPSRWGQRMTPLPDGFGRTDAENIRLAVPALPEMPFAGIAYEAQVAWDYDRLGDGGTLSASTVDQRANKHVLFGKRVWTDAKRYQAGQRVEICAEIATLQPSNAEEYFVVAHAYSRSSPQRVLRRVLVPGRCKLRPKPTRVCLRGFPDGVPGEDADLPMQVNSFGFGSDATATFVGPLDGGEIGLSLPTTPLRITTPPATRVLIEFAKGPTVHARARNSAGLVVDEATLPEGGGTLDLSSLEIVDVELLGPEAILVQVCAVSDEWQPHDEHQKRVTRHAYQGHIDLGLNEALGEWGISLSVQNVDLTPAGSDPITAASTVGGITESASIVGVALAACGLVFLFDYVFDVI